jgi:prophage maintenance system killer protein
MCDDQPRITDLSSLDPENFKFRNTDFLTGDTHYDMLPHQSREELRRQIWNVRNGDLRRVLDEFPTDEPLADQCALWMHAVVGKHFFPDANHRTAMALLRRLLRENNINAGDWPIERIEQAREESHEVRQEIPSVRLDTLYERDELYEVWKRFFDDVLEVDCSADE